jgi:hypothetical protein
VHGDATEQRRIRLDDLAREPDPGRVAADLDQAVDPHGGCCRDGLARRRRFLPVPGDVEVDVVVDDRDGEGVGGGGPLLPAARGEPR